MQTNKIWTANSGFMGALRSGSRTAEDCEVRAYLEWTRERRGLPALDLSELEWASYPGSRDRLCIGGTFGEKTEAARWITQSRYEDGRHVPGEYREAQYEPGSYSLLMPGHDAHKQRVTFETLDEAGEVERSQTLPREPKKGGVIWSREEVRKACGPVLKVAKPRKVKSAPIAEPAAAPPIEAPEIPASAGAGERVEAPDAPMGQIDADALSEAPTGEIEPSPETGQLDADPIAELTARLAALESRVATLSGESIAAPTVAKRTPAHERAIRRAWVERKAARLQRSIAADQMRMREQVQDEANRQGRIHSQSMAMMGEALRKGNAKRRRAVLFARDLQKRLNAEYALVDRANTKRSEAEEAARDWSRKEEAQRQRANVAEAALTKLRADLADPHQPERESDLLLLKRQRDDARAEAERERNAAAAVNERNARLQSVMADLGERFEVMAGRVARAEAALRVQGAVA